MFNGSNGYSLADIAAATGNNGRSGGCGDGFGEGNGAWLIIILFLFVFCGWGGNGWGNNWGNNGGGAGSPTFQGAITRGDLCSEFSFNDLQSGVRGLQQGLCSLGYDQLAQFNSVNTNVANLNSNLNNAICQLGYNVQQGQNDTNLAILNASNAATIAAMQNQNALQTQLADCCCTQRSEIKDVQYALATNACAINTNNATNTRDIIDSQNANTRAILEAIQQGKIDAMQDRIATLTAQNNQLAFQASQAAQNEYLISQLGQKCPIPAYPACSPYETPGYLRDYSRCNCNA